MNELVLIKDDSVTSKKSKLSCSESHKYIKDLQTSCKQIVSRWHMLAETPAELKLHMEKDRQIKNIKAGWRTAQKKKKTET